MENNLPPDPENKNHHRAAWILVALTEFQDLTDCDTEDLVCDFLTDLAHYCDHYKVDLAHELRRATRHYREETDHVGLQLLEA